MNEKNIHSGPTMLYDGDCGFCQRWISRWQKKNGANIEYAPHQEARKNFPGVSEEDCKEAIQLIMPDGSRTSGAHAIFKAMEIGGSSWLLHWLYEHMRFFGSASEVGYQWIAHHRLFLSKFSGDGVKKCG